MIYDVEYDEILNKYSVFCLGTATDTVTELAAYKWVVEQMAEFLEDIINWDNPDESIAILKSRKRGLK